jgi:hypothetical protein
MGFSGRAINAKMILKINYTGLQNYFLSGYIRAWYKNGLVYAVNILLALVGYFTDLIEPLRCLDCLPGYPSHQV